MYNQVDNDAYATAMGYIYETAEFIHASILWIDRIIICDIVTMGGWGWVDGHQPDPCDAQVGCSAWIAIIQVIQLFDQTIEIANTILVAVIESSDRNLIKDSLIPPRIN